MKKLFLILPAIALCMGLGAMSYEAEAKGAAPADLCKKTQEFRDECLKSSFSESHPSIPECTTQKKPNPNPENLWVETCRCIDYTGKVQSTPAPWTSDPFKGIPKLCALIDEAIDPDDKDVCKFIDPLDPKKCLNDPDYETNPTPWPPYPTKK